MPSPRKRIGFLPSEEVHEIIDKLCSANKFSQSKVTGLLVEEALRSRGVLSDSFNINNSGNGNDFTVNKRAFADEIEMMYEFIEFKYFKKVLRQNNNIFE